MKVVWCLPGGPPKSPFTLDDFIVHYLDLITPHSSQMMLIKWIFLHFDWYIVLYDVREVEGKVAFLSQGRAGREMRKRAGLVVGLSIRCGGGLRYSAWQKLPSAPAHTRDYFNCALIRKDIVISPRSKLCWVRTREILTELDFARRRFTVVFLKAEHEAIGPALCFHDSLFISF